MAAPCAALDLRSRRSRPGAGPPTPSEASGVAGVAGEGRPSAALPGLPFPRRKLGTAPSRAPARGARILQP
jgi:hypothetical protein